MNKDDHYLDWRYITENNSEKSNKGIIFENLIENLIKAMFPQEKWRRTGVSHDGKRDFVYPADENLLDKKWAECKNYSEKLSINTIAPTLVMGAIKNIECIYFFSYSPLNDNAIEGIVSYSKKSKKIVQVFDGILLENLIYKYRLVYGIEKFFPKNTFQKNYNGSRRKFRIVKNLKDLSGNKISVNHVFDARQSFVISVIIQNLSDSTIRYSLELELSEISCSNTNIHEGSLKFGQIIECAFFCQTVKKGSFKYRIKCLEKDTEYKEETYGIINVSEDEFGFLTGENALKCYAICENHLTNYKSNPLFISADRGTGKTTLINILKNENSIYSKYLIQNIDISCTRNICARNLLYQNLEITVDTSIDSEEQESEKIKALSWLIEGCAASAAEIAETLMTLYDENKPYLFVIDNAHEMPREYSDLVGELITASKQNRKRIYFIYGINPNEMSIGDLLYQIYWDEPFDEHKIDIAKLSNFVKTDIIAYGKHKYGLESIEQYFENFDDHQEVSPRNVCNLFCRLKFDGVISPIPNTNKFQLVDAFAFREYIKNYAYSDLSSSNYCKIIDDRGHYTYVLEYVYITGSVSATLKKRKKTIVDELINCGILKNEQKKIVFVSNEIREEVKGKLNFSDENLIDICNDIDTNDESKAICFLSNLKLFKNSFDFLRNFFTSDHQFNSINIRYEICCLVFDKLKELLEMELGNSALKFLQKNYPLLNREQGHYSFYCFLEKAILAAILNDWDIDSESIEIMSFFIKKHFDRALSTYNHIDVVQNYNIIKEKFNSLKRISSFQKYYWLCHFANRAAISLDRSSDPFIQETSAVTLLYKESEDNCRLCGYTEELEMQIKIDNFYRHYVYRHSLTMGVLNDTHSELLKYKEGKLYDDRSLNYHLILIDCLKIALNNCEPRDQKEITKLLKRLREAQYKCQSKFYFLKYYLIELYCLIQLNNISEAYKTLEKAYNFVLKNDIRNSVYKLTYIRAFLHFFEADNIVTTEVVSQITLGFEQFVRCKIKSLQDFKREIFLPVELAKRIKFFSKEYMLNIVKNIDCSEEQLNFICDFCAYISGEKAENNQLFSLKSYFMIHGVCFPHM